MKTNSSASDNQRRGKAVLLVDDEPLVRSYIKTTLERAGLRVLQAEDGIDALKLLETIKPDLLLTDIDMPRMNGIALEGEATRRLPGMPVLLMSLFGSGEPIFATRRTCIRKPFTARMLLDMVTQVM